MGVMRGIRAMGAMRAAGAPGSRVSGQVQFEAE
jgi:hypothetical protein